MAGNEGSCSKKLLLGCGCVFSVCLAGALCVGLLFATSRPKTPVFSTHSDSQEFESSELEGLVLPALPEEAKPVVLKLDTTLANLRILPSDEGGGVNLTAEYDTANYELQSQVITGDRSMTYEVSFKPKGGFFRFLRDDKSGHNRNEITILVPKDLAVAIELDFAMGDCEMDLSGIPTIALGLELSMAKAEIRCDTVNAVPMDEVSLSSSMTEINWQGFDKLRTSKAELELSMGETTLAFDRPLEHDVEVQLEASMGGLFFHVHPDQVVESDVELSMGEYRGPRAAPQGEPGHRLRLRGEMSMGNLEVLRK